MSTPTTYEFTHALQRLHEKNSLESHSKTAFWNLKVLKVSNTKDLKWRSNFANFMTGNGTD